MHALTIFLHSTGTLPVMWEPFRPIMAPLGDVVMPAHIGYPPHAPLAHGAPFALQDDVDAIARLVPDSATAVHLVAHSYGGVVALELARRLGARLRSVFIHEPVLFGLLLAADDADVDSRDALRALLPAFLSDRVHGGDDAWLSQFIDYWNRPGSWARLPEARQAETRAIGWKMYQEVRTVLTTVSSLDAIGADVAVTITVGSDTRAEARAVAELVGRRLPHASIVTLPGTRHMAPLTHPALVSEALTAHVNRL